MTTNNRIFPRFAATLLAALMFGFASAAAAQDMPQPPSVISPLHSEPDPNGVNIVDGKKNVDMPVVLSIAAAPRLTFDKAPNAAPYITGDGKGGGVDGGATTLNESFSVHIGAQTSDSFNCVDGDCQSLTYSGSRLLRRVYTRAPGGEIYAFGYQSSDTTTNGTHHIQYYVGAITYPDGESITYEYDTAAASSLQTVYRPTKISSNVGYYIKIDYDTSKPLGDMAWGVPIQAAIYKTSGNALIRRVKYNADGTVTDYGNNATDVGGRTFTSNVGNAVGANVEQAAVSIKLPGESSPQLAINGSNHGLAEPLIDSVVRDGVTWTYTYDNPRMYKACVIPPLYVLRYDGVTVTGPDGYKATYAMSGAGGSDNPQSNCGSANFQPYHNLIASSTDALNHKTSYVYDSAHGDRVSKVTFPEGNYVAIDYDDCGNVISKTTVSKSGAETIREAAVFPTGEIGDPAMCRGVLTYRPSSYTDARGHTTNYTYNSHGQMTQELAPADASGVRRETDVTYEEHLLPDGVHTISRKAMVRVCGQTTTCSGAAQSHTEYTYLADTNLPLTVTQVDETLADTDPAKRRITTYRYDDAGRVTMIDGPLPTPAHDEKYFQYDTYGRKIWEVAELAPNGTRLAKKFVYRNSDDKVAQISTGTVVCDADCDQRSVALSVLLNQADTTYDSRRYPIREKTYHSTTTFSVTDRSFLDRGLNDCTTVRMNFAALPDPASTPACALGMQGDDGPDRITKNSYDAGGHLTKVQKAFLITIANGFPETLQADYATYTYTPNGKQEYVTDANGNKARFVYDGFDRLFQWQFPSKTTPGVVNSADYEQYGYDANGNRTSLRKRDNRTLTYIYDNLNRAIHKGGDIGDVLYTYDVVGHQLTAKYSSSGQGITSAYNGFGELTSTTSDMGGTARTLRYGYDAVGRRTQVIYPENSSSYTFIYAYDALGRPSYLCRGGGTCDSSSSTLMDSFTYGTNGLVGSRAETGGSSVAYGWDDAGRLTSQTDAFTGGTGNVGWTFGFNSGSQIANETRTNDSYAWTGAVTVNRNYAANGLNQYTSAGPATFTYDANGNLTGDGTWTYTYDAENRLVTAVGSGVSATLSYDPLGRLWKYAGTGVGDVIFIYDGDALVAEYSPSTLAMTNRYVHGPNAAADDPMVWYNGATVANTARHWLHADHLGSIVAASDSSGGNPAINTYDEYGIPGSANQGRFQYTGQAWLGEIGMYYYKARIYSPTLGRFLQTDPVGYAGGINLYGYVGDDPVNFLDPTGTYNCEKEQCKQVEKYVSQLRAAAQTPETGTRIVNSTMRSMVTLLGTMNDGNKINIAIGDIRGEKDGETALSGGKANISLDRNIGNDSKYGAAVLAHETVHAAQFLNRGEPVSLKDVDQRERAAYSVMSFVSQRMQVETRVWWPGITPRERAGAIRAGAHDSCISTSIGSPPNYREPFPGQNCP